MSGGDGARLIRRACREKRRRREELPARISRSRFNTVKRTWGTAGMYKEPLAGGDKYVKFPFFSVNFLLWPGRRALYVYNQVLYKVPASIGSLTPTYITTYGGRPHKSSARGSLVFKLSCAVYLYIYIYSMCAAALDLVIIIKNSQRAPLLARRQARSSVRCAECFVFSFVIAPQQ